MGGIRGWLQAVGLGQYAELFEREQIDLEAVRHLSDAHLKELGIPMGPRLKLLAAIQALGEAPVSNDAQPGAGAKADSEHMSAPAGRVERRQLTVMFCDLVGSTGLAEQLDPEELRELMRAYQGICGQAVERYEGHVAQYLGDGLMVYFGWPRAHEDDAERAVRAGLDIVDAVKRVQAPEPLRVRMGIATGPVVVGETGAGDASVPKMAVGETPNLASRVQGLAGPDEIVIAPTTRRLLGSAFDLEDLGAHVLRGIVEPVRAFRVLRASRVEGRFEATRGTRLTPLVGRDSELALLLERWRQATVSDGQAVVLSGEPGVGKSRIARALRSRIEGEPHGFVQYQCSPFFLNSALYPVIEQIKRAAGFDEEEASERKFAKLEALLEGAGGAALDALPLLAALLSLPTEGRYPPLELSPRRQRERTIEVIAEQLRRLAAVAPLLVVFEDVHWIDPTTRELIDHLVGRIADARMLVLITHRPEFDPAWGAHAHITLHSLNRLAKRQCALLVERMAPKPLPEALVAQIVDKTDGVPLFVEELTKAVLESDVVVDRADRYELSGAIDSLRIPATLHDSLMARLDQLLPVKEVAQIGAAIGREFSYQLLGAVSPMGGDELHAALESFVRSELVYQRGSPPQATYLFKHALVQDAAYDSLLKRRRAELHQRIAHALETRFKDTVETEPETIAHHYSAAGVADKAVPYWLKAGHNAIRRAANKEAVGHLTRGLALLPLLAPSHERDVCELELLLALGEAQTRGGENLEAMRTFEQAADKARALDAVEALARAAMGLEEVAHRFGLPGTNAITLLRSVLDILGDQNAILKVEVLSALTRALNFAGLLAEAESVSEQAVAIAARLGDPTLLAMALYPSIAVHMAGRWKPERLEARLSDIRKALRHPEQFQDKEKVLNLWSGTLLGEMWLGNMPVAAAALKGFIQLAEEQRIPYYTYFGISSAAGLAFFQGRFAESEALAERALEAAGPLSGLDASGMYSVQMFSLRREQGRLVELAPLVTHFVEATSKEGIWRPGLVVIYAELELWDKARAEFESVAADEFKAIPEDSNWLNCIGMLAEVCCRLGDGGRAATLYTFLSPYVRCNVVASPCIASYGVAARHLGMLAATMQRWDEAERHFRTALESNEQQGGRPWVAHTQHQYAAMLLARNQPGDRHRASALLAHASASSRELGMETLVLRTAALQERLRL